MTQFHQWYQELQVERTIKALKKNNFDTAGCEARLTRPSVYPLELSPLLQELFEELYEEKEIYRATGIVLVDLVPDTPVQYSLFEDPVKAEKIRQLYEAADILSGKYGKHTLHLGSSHPLEVLGKGRRGTPTVRERTQLYGETRRRHLGLPLFQAEAHESPAESTENGLLGHPNSDPCQSDQTKPNEEHDGGFRYGRRRRIIHEISCGQPHITPDIPTILLPVRKNIEAPTVN
jgi:hypothetical protein